MLPAKDMTLAPLTDPAMWQRMEYRIDGVPSVDNPFDPDQIGIDATFTAPSGGVMVVPAFWYQAYERELVDGAEKLRAVGNPEWRLRFTPSEAGHYRVAVAAVFAGKGPQALAEAAFDVAPREIAGRHGWVRIGPDARYFETSDGRPLRLIGENVCWAAERGTYDFDDWFSGMEAAGENYARLWLDPWFMGIEHKPDSLNNYQMDGAWKLDHIFDLAAKHGIYLMICFDHHGMYQTDDKGWGGTNNFWDTDNPYSKTFGGPCADADEFFTSAVARKLYEKRLRYLVARYAYSPNLQSWQFFNEIDNIYRQSVIVPEHVLAWHKYMAPALKRIDPFGHLVTTSLTGGSIRDEYWQIPDIDFSMYHSYADPAPGRKVAQVADRYVREFKKPFMVGEYGTSAYSLNLERDPYLRGFRQLLWSGVASGSVGTSMSWWWEDIHSQDVYPVYSTLRKVLDEAGWQEGAWTPIASDWTPPPLELGEPVAGAEPFSADIALNDFRRIALGCEAAIASPLAAARASEALQTYVRAPGDPLCRPMRMHVLAGKGAVLSAKADSVAGDAEMVVRVDGAELFRTAVPRTGDLSAISSPVDESFSIPLPEGRHVVEITNEGADWIHLKSLRIANLLPTAFAGGWTFKPEILGLLGPDRAVIYIVSPDAVYPANALTYNPPPVKGAKLRFAGLKGGEYSVRWFDTATGDLVADCRASVDGEATLDVPDFNDDLVAVVRRVE
ncbi:MAG: DUF5060 domain-containing protein [Opitutales bacterium]